MRLFLLSRLICCVCLLYGFISLRTPKTQYLPHRAEPRSNNQKTVHVGIHTYLKRTRTLPIYIFPSFSIQTLKHTIMKKQNVKTLQLQKKSIATFDPSKIKAGYSHSNVNVTHENCCYPL